MAENDVINHPSHYAEGRKYEPIDVFIDWDLGPLEWQVCKYLSRLGRKGSALEDARKAQFYMTRLVTELEREQIDNVDKVDASVNTPGFINADALDRNQVAVDDDDFFMRHIRTGSPEPITINFEINEMDEDLLSVLIGDAPARA